MSDSIRHRFRVTLLGTGAPPPVLDRFGPSTLVEVGEEKFIFDAGRGAMQRLHQLGIPFAGITGLFLTHHHSDHVVGFVDLWLTGWIGRPWGKRQTPLCVWGPEGTKQMMEHLPLRRRLLCFGESPPFHAFADIDVHQVFSDDQRTRINLARCRDQIIGSGAAEKQEMVVDRQLRFDARENLTRLLRSGVIAANSF
jgi:ribonuclease BN (tRNA processing enzyme)